jgi:hypothetical protein
MSPAPSLRSRHRKFSATTGRSASACRPGTQLLTGSSAWSASSRIAGLGVSAPAFPRSIQKPQVRLVLFASMPDTALPMSSDSSPGCAPEPGPGCRCSMASNRAAAPCLRATRSDRPDRPARPAGRGALTAAPAPVTTPVTDWLQAVNVAAGPRRAAGRVSRSDEVGRDRVGGVAVQAVPGVVVPARRAGVLVPGVVLHVAQGRAGIEREGDRRVPQAVRG